MEQKESGKYEIVRKFESGAFGTTYLVEDEDGNKYVQKVPNEQSDLHYQFYTIQQFDQEATILDHIRRWCSPYLVCVKEIAKNPNGSVKYILMDYIPDTRELLDVAMEDPPFFRNKIAKIVLMKNLLLGLQLLHWISVAHRDIKPENILINTETLQTHYIDYGASCLETNIPCLEKFAGTLAYTAPELWRLDHIQERYPHAAWRICKAADVWSLGVTFCVICFGFSPFQEIERQGKDKLRELMLGMQSDDVKFLLDRYLPKRLSRREKVLRKFILYMLNPDWERRVTAEQAFTFLSDKITPKIASYDEIEAFKSRLNASKLKEN